jgi:ABC-type lipoprotein export system ATPase subunit
VNRITPITRPVVEAHGLVKRYRQGDSTINAIDGIDIRVGAGEFVAVAGRSGSGKTTLLDIVGLLLRPDEGSVTIEGVDGWTTGDRARARLRANRLGFIFQEFNLMPYLSALENVLLPLEYSRRDRRQARQRACELLATLGMQARMNHRPSELSAGQQQRVAVARALINDPAAVLADEPTGALDSRTAADLLALLKRVNEDGRTAFLIVTHDPDLAIAADRVLTLSDGCIVDSARLPQQRPGENAGREHG